MHNAVIPPCIGVGPKIGEMRALLSCSHHELHSGIIAILRSLSGADHNDFYSTLLARLYFIHFPAPHRITPYS